MFKDKVIVITGATSGIGRSLALALAEEGARLVLADSKPPEPAAATIHGAQFERADVALEDDIRRLIEHAYATHGRIDYFLSDAGMTLEMDASVAEGDWDSIVAVNQTSHVRVARHLGEHALALRPAASSSTLASST